VLQKYSFGCVDKVNMPQRVYLSQECFKVTSFMSQIVYKESVTVVTGPYPPTSVRNKYLIWFNDSSVDYITMLFLLLTA